MKRSVAEAVIARIEQRSMFVPMDICGDTSAGTSHEIMETLRALEALYREGYLAERDYLRTHYLYHPKGADPSQYTRSHFRTEVRSHRIIRKLSHQPNGFSPTPLHGTLEASIEDAPEDQTLRTVYADWLMSIGDPRGVAIAMEWAGEPNYGERLSDILSCEIPSDPPVELDAPAGDAWRLGFVDRYTFTTMEDEDQSKGVLSRVLSLPSFRFLRVLEIQLRNPYPFLWIPLALRSLRPPRTLRELVFTEDFVSDGDDDGDDDLDEDPNHLDVEERLERDASANRSVTRLDLNAVLPFFPTITTLKIQASRVAWTPSPSALQCLHHTHVDGPLLRKIAEHGANLVELRMAQDLRDYQNGFGTVLDDVLHRPGALPLLRKLSAPMNSNTFFRFAAGSPLRPQLETVDLRGSGRLEDVAAEAFLSNRHMFPNLRRIEFDPEAFRRDMRDRFRKELGPLTSFHIAESRC